MLKKLHQRLLFFNLRWTINYDSGQVAYKNYLTLEADLYEISISFLKTSATMNGAAKEIYDIHIVLLISIFYGNEPERF